MSTLVLENIPASPTKVKPTGTYVYHNVIDKVSIGATLHKDNTVVVALAVCSPRDQFSRHRAQFILRARLAARKTHREGLTFELGTYSGNEFKTDVFTPLLKFVRDNAYLFLVRDNYYGDSQNNDLLLDLVDELRSIREHPDSNLQ